MADQRAAGEGSTHGQRGEIILLSTQPESRGAKEPMVFRETSQILQVRRTQTLQRAEAGGLGADEDSRRRALGAGSQPRRRKQRQSICGKQSGSRRATCPPPHPPAARSCFLEDVGPPAAAAAALPGSSGREAVAAGGSSTARSPASGPGARGLQAARRRLPRQHLRATPVPPTKPKCSRLGPVPAPGRGSESGMAGASPPRLRARAGQAPPRKGALFVRPERGCQGGSGALAPPKKGQSRALGGGC